MSKTYAYFREKSSALIRALFIDEGDARHRLLKNEFEIMYVLSLDVPEDLEDKRQAIVTSLTKSGKNLYLGRQGSAFSNTVSSIRNSTASNILANIYNLYKAVDNRFS